MKTRISKLLAATAASALALTGCSFDDSATDTVQSEDGTVINQEPIRMSLVHGWEVGIAATYLWKTILENKGYNVEIVELTDIGPSFVALVEHDLDLITETWLPYTNARQMEEFGDDVEDLGPWYENAHLTFTVNDDSPITSIEELAEYADDFGNKIFTIEPGSGTAEVAEDSVMKSYGLDENMELIPSSTSGMFAELNAALQRDENIVVTLWEPHWAYDEFPIRNLEDPKEALGDSETINAFSRTGFADDYPEVDSWLRNFTMNNEQMNSLQNAMFNEYDGDDYTPIVQEWILENSDYVDSLTN